MPARSKRSEKVHEKSHAKARDFSVICERGRRHAATPNHLRIFKTQQRLSVGRAFNLAIVFGANKTTFFCKLWRKENHTRLLLSLRRKESRAFPPFAIITEKRLHYVMPFFPQFARKHFCRRVSRWGLNCCQSHRREKPNAEAATRRMLGFSKTHDFFPRQFAEKSVNKKI